MSRTARTVNCKVSQLRETILPSDFRSGFGFLEEIETGAYISFRGLLIVLIFYVIIISNA